jgi:hypothetical protein
MKNYKHSVKSNNAMKLAAVASAAIMMAPVALNSVSTFADSTNYSPVISSNKDDNASTTNAATTAYASEATAVKNLGTANYNAGKAWASLSAADQKTYYSDVAAANKDAQTITTTLKSYVDGTSTDLGLKSLYAAVVDGQSRVKNAANATDKAKAQTDLNAAQAKFDAAKLTLDKSIAQAVTATARINALTAKMEAKTPAGALKASIAKAQTYADSIKSSNPGYYAVLTANIKAAQTSLAANIVTSATAPKTTMSYAKSQLDGSLARITNEITTGAAAKQTGIAHINYAKGYGIQIWTKDHKLVLNEDGTGKKAKGTWNYKVFGPAVTISGKTYYCLGGNQYVDAAYVTFTANK